MLSRLSTGSQTPGGFLCNQKRHFRKMPLLSHTSFVLRVTESPNLCKVNTLQITLLFQNHLSENHWWHFILNDWKKIKQNFKYKFHMKESQWCYWIHFFLGGKITGSSEIQLGASPSQLPLPFMVSLGPPVCTILENCLVYYSHQCCKHWSPIFPTVF